ncbi:PhzF family phenazine biosynthesis protein [Frondihabitans sp. PhB188]|uniref:PhzF family phenazine biosynthesis protein n=1 Tax=Frondihabitans sp. PhB188 TaxID=2485200 RepID=UPI000F46B39E|nr:PhzF family phenazine biosynthesis protein [Frondihabitans sp. PhB188]ROQ38673.1 PhzF family phenazine biosynthesis protein [Frondihabitans sp. PhB188]
MIKRSFSQVDVFSSVPYLGNPVAVVLDADGVTDEAMAAFARWTNLSETTFVLPPTTPDADYRLRIFTPGGELPFAGHPTLGSAHAWLEAGGVPARGDLIVQECIAGLIDIRRDGATLAFAAPPTTRSGPVDEETVERIARGLGVERSEILSHQWIVNGPPWLAVELASAERVLALEPDLSIIPDLNTGVFGAYPEGHEHAHEVRGFVPIIGVPEDPVTGSLNASLAQWLHREGRTPAAYTNGQGTRLGRDGVVRITVVDDAVWVGGESTTAIAGTVLL